jgi:Ca2+-binding EF-hand superfamily protein
MIAALQKISRAAECHGITVRTELEAGDLARNGFICRSLFRKILNLLPSRISDTDFSLIARRYARKGTDMISYRDFCDDLDEYGNSCDESHSIEFCRKPEDLQASLKALRLFKAALTFGQMQPIELFDSVDPSKLGTVASSALQKVFAPLRPLLDEHTLLQIEEDFRDARQPEKFNYRRLCVALGYVKVEENDMNDIRENSKMVLTKSRRVLDKVVAGINHSLTSKKRTVRELFTDIRDETIGATTFRNRIERPGIKISQTDMDSLVRKYRVTGRSNEIDWDQFCVDVEGSDQFLGGV